MKNSLISIVIPVYNSEKYLNELLSSVVSQSYSNFEVIIINDGSTDNSEDICLEFSKNDNRIKYFKKENSGVSDTRNFGILKATGEYICFVDSDDILGPDYLLDFVDNIIENDSDLSCCKFNKFKNEIVNSYELFSNTKYDGMGKFDLLYSSYGGYISNKLFKLKFIKDNDLKFNMNIHMCEDMLFVFQYLKNCKSVTCFDKKNYNYRIIEQSASKNLCNEKWYSLFKVMDVILNEKDLLLNDTFLKVNFFYELYLYEGLYRLNFIKDSKKYSDIKNDINLRIKNLKKNNNYTFIQRIKLVMYKKFNKIAFKIKKMRESRSI